jgi:hypothetical protein
VPVLGILHLDGVGLVGDRKLLVELLVLVLAICKEFEVRTQEPPP